MSSPELVITERNGTRSFSVEFTPGRGKSLHPKLGREIARIALGPILSKMKIDHLRTLYEQGLLGEGPTGQGERKATGVGADPPREI